MFKLIFGLILIGGGFLQALFADPVWGLYLFAALTHIRLEQLGENFTLPLRIPIVIASVTIVMYVFSSKYASKFSKWPLEVWLFGIMVLGMCLGADSAKFDPQMSWGLATDYLKYWIFFILFVQMIDSIKKVEQFHWVMILSAAWLVYRCWDLRGTTGPRFENLGGGSVSDANHFAAALVLLFPFVFQKVFASDRKVALGAAILCFGVIMGIIISGSRGGFLGIGALAALILFSYRGQRWKIFGLLAIVGLVALAFVSEYQMERFESIFEAVDPGQRDRSIQLRLEFWGLAVQLFRENPILGIAPGEFAYYSGFLVEGHHYGVPGHVTHSLWFEMLTQGLVVVVPFLIMIMRFFWKSWYLVRQYRAAGEHEAASYVLTPMLALAAFFVPATFLDRSVYEPIYWCIGLGIAHRYIFEKRAQEVVERAPRDMPPDDVMLTRP